MYSLLKKDPELLATLSTCTPGKVGDDGYQVYAFSDAWYKATPPAVRYVITSSASADISLATDR